MFLCDFHREQAWERWVSKGSNNVSHCKDELLARMREIACAEDTAIFNDAVEALKQLPIWNQNKALRDWFLGTWLKESKVQNTSLLVWFLMQSLSVATYKDEKKKNISASNNI